MKKLTLILALAMLALFTQCKKQDNTQDILTNGIQMVLTANNGGSRTTFGTNGSISWNTNEKIYVVTGGKCVGHVTNGNEGGNTFTGTLNGITADGTYDFHYYYVGNTQVIANNATSFTMDFSDQDGTLANLGDFHVGYGVQNGVEVTTGTPITAQTSMKSLVSMAYFDLAGMAETGEKVYFYGEHINNQLSIDFSINAVAYDKVNSGQICAGAVVEGSTSPCYVMLLPNHSNGTEELTTDFTFISKRTTGTCNGVFNYGIVGDRFYCANGETDTPMALTVASYDKGTLRGVFSVSASQTVHFSQGNLQYIGSAPKPYWKFAENQWDYLGITTGQNSADVNVDRDLFGWGTSGWNNGNLYYQPYNTEKGDWEVAYGYGPTDGTNYSYDLIGSYANADWGIYNAIFNGGNIEGYWRTLSKTEWDYLRGRSNSYAMAIVGGVNGFILLPDDWDPSIYSLKLIDHLGGGYSANTITVKDWTDKLEVHGAIFLPAAGGRTLSGEEIVINGLGESGSYWSIFNTSSFTTRTFSRSVASSVRLVR